MTDPKIWGHCAWKFLYTVALNYPTRPDFQEIHNYKRFFTYLQYVIPCPKCRVNYANHLLEIPIDPYLTSRDHLFEWVRKIDNLVRQESGKPPLDRQQVFVTYFGSEPQKYTYDPSKDLVGGGHDQKKMWLGIIAVALVLGVVLWKRRS